jgi:hypothetical protein
MKKLLSYTKWGHFKVSNVKAVKKKRSTNVPQTFRHLTENEPKLLSLFSNLVHRNSTFLFNPGEQILVLIKTICSLQDKFGNDFKTFWFRFQNGIGTFLLPFLTFLH